MASLAQQDPVTSTTQRNQSPNLSPSDDECRQQIEEHRLQAAQVASRIPGHQFAQDELQRWSTMTIDDFRDFRNSEIERLASEQADELKAERLRRQDEFDELIRTQGSRYADCTFGNYEVTCDRQQAAVEKLRGYAENIRENIVSGKSIVLFGSSGTGKDHLLVALARVAILRCGRGIIQRSNHDSNYSVRPIAWTSGAKLRSDMRDVIRSNTPEWQLLGPLTDAGVLWLSDPAIGGSALTDYQADALYHVIDTRYRERRPVWATINCAGRDELNTSLGGAIVDRLVDGALTIGCDWPSYRKPGA